MTEVINKENNSGLISEQLKIYTDSLSLNLHPITNFNTLLPLKKNKKQVLFKRSPRVINSSNNWSERGVLKEKILT